MNETGKGSGIQSYLNFMMKGLRHLLLHNGWLKGIAVVISIVLWAGLISQDESVTRDKTFQNVNVSVTGSEIMKSNGYIVVSKLDEMLNDVSIVSAVPQKQYDNAEASAYNVRLDLSRVQGTGEQEVKILYTNSNLYGKVVSVNPSTVKLEVEDYIIRQRIPVSVEVNGDIPEGWYMSKPSVDPVLIAVSGPKSLVETISKAGAVIDTKDIAWKEGTMGTSVKIHLYNRTGTEVTSSLLSTTTSSLTIDSVVVEVNLLPCRSFSAEDAVLITGTAAEGYQVKNVRFSPEQITVAAKQDILDQLSELPLDRSTVNVTGLTETTVFQLKVQKPSEEATLSNDTITVTVEIEAEEQL